MNTILPLYIATSINQSQTVIFTQHRHRSISWKWFSLFSSRDATASQTSDIEEHPKNRCITIKMHLCHSTTCSSRVICALSYLHPTILFIIEHQITFTFFTQSNARNQKHYSLRWMVQKFGLPSVVVVIPFCFSKTRHMQPVDLNRILPSALLLAFESALICMDAGLSSKHGDGFSAVYGLYKMRVSDSPFFCHGNLSSSFWAYSYDVLSSICNRPLLNSLNAWTLISRNVY